MQTSRKKIKSLLCPHAEVNFKCILEYRSEQFCPYIKYINIHTNTLQKLKHCMHTVLKTAV